MDNPESHASRPSPSAERTVTQAEQEVMVELDAQVKNITDQNVTDQVKQNDLIRFGESLNLKAMEQIEELIDLENKTKNLPNKKKIMNEKKQETVVDLRKMTLATKKGIKINPNEKTQRFIEKLAEKQLTDDELIVIFTTLDEYLLGSKEITISSNAQEISDFENSIIQIQLTNPEAAQKLIDTLAERAALFGTEKNEIRRKFGKLIKMMSRENNRPEQIINEYFSYFPKEQREFLNKLFKPELFLEYINDRRNHMMNNSAHISEHIKVIYLKRYGKNPDEATLKDLIDRQIRIDVSEEISGEIINVLTQLYNRFNIESAHKPSDEIENEDFMHGINTTKSYIFNGLQLLDNTFREMEVENPNDPRLIKMFRKAEHESETIDIDYKGNKKPVSRLKPVPYFKEVSLAEFMINQMSNFGHWREGIKYTHDVSYIFNHPPHEGVFYKQLGEYAEAVGGVGLDGFLGLPDGKLMVHTYHLYDKFLEEAMAKVDHKVIASMFQNRLEEIHSEIGGKVREYLKLEYGDEISETRLMTAMNKAIGMAKGIFLTEPEKLAYCDPTDHKGRGAFQSYGTNDAGSLMALNPLHLILRWQSDANLQQIYFLPAGGESFTWKGFNHRVAWKNSKEFMESFKSLKHGRESSERNLVIDKILNLSKAASMYQRNGWRDFYQFESHFTYNENLDGIKLVESFKSMDVIGYEAVNWFLRNIDMSFYQAYDKTYMEKTKLTDVEINKLIKAGLDKNPPEIISREKLIADNQELIDQREALFRHIYKEYFEPLLPDPKPGEIKQTYESYIAKLRTKAEKMVKKRVTDKTDKQKYQTVEFDNYDQAVQKQISDLFVEGAVSRFVAARFPTKFLRIDRDRFQKSGIGRWRQIYEEMKSTKEYEGINRDKFGEIMNDLEFAEELLRNDTSEMIESSVHLLPPDKNNPNVSLGDHADLLYNLNEKSITELLRSKGLTPERIKKTIDLYTLIKEKFIGKEEFLDGEAVEAINKYPFSFGVENTDMKLIAYRGTGPRMVARQIKDIAAMEKTVIGGFVGLPQMFGEIAKTGDFSPLIKYLKECQNVFLDVHGRGADYEFNQMVAGMLVNYMRRDEGAKDLFGLGGVGSINSIAAELAGNSNLVREWDSRDIDRFSNALQAEGLLKGNNYDQSTGPKYEHIWKIDKSTGIPKMTGSKQIKEEYKFSIKTFREKFGGDWKSMGREAIKEILPLLLIFLVWQYIKKAFEETFGGKKG